MSRSARPQPEAPSQSGTAPSPPGTLYVVATPLGNLGDMTLRGLEVLRAVQFVACEDTRRTAKLLGHFGIAKPRVSYHDWNEQARFRQIVERLLAGESAALVSDAGTPMLSDPGHLLVKASLEAGVPVVPVPGPSALAAALSVCHLPVEQFVFAGFLPARSAQRRKALQALAAQSLAIVLFEAPHRLLACLEDALEIMGARRCLCARELTKLREEFLRRPLSEVLADFRLRPRVQGEFTLVLEGVTPAGETAENGDEALREEYLACRGRGDSLRQAVDALARRHRLPRNRIYRLALEWSRQ